MQKFARFAWLAALAGIFSVLGFFLVDSDDVVVAQGSPFPLPIPQVSDLSLNAGTYFTLGCADVGRVYRCLSSDADKDTFIPSNVPGLMEGVAQVAEANHDRLANEDILRDTLVLLDSGIIKYFGRNGGLPMSYQNFNRSNVFTAGAEVIPANAVTIDLTGVVDIDIARSFAIALREDWTVRMRWKVWEDPISSSFTNKNDAVPFQFNLWWIGTTHKIVDVSAGPDYALMLDQSGSVRARWVDDIWTAQNYQTHRVWWSLDIATTPRQIQKLDWQILTGIVQIDAGWRHAIARDREGSVRHRGTYQKLCVSRACPTTRFDPLNNRNLWSYQYISLTGAERVTEIDIPAVDVSAGGHSIVADASGNVWTRGRNAEGQIGNGKNRADTLNGFQQTPLKLNRHLTFAGQRILQVSAGFAASHAVSNDGRRWSRGGNAQWALGIGSSDTTIPQQNPLLTGVIAAEWAGRHSSLITRPKGQNFPVFPWGDFADVATAFPLGDTRNRRMNHTQAGSQTSLDSPTCFDDDTIPGDGCDENLQLEYATCGSITTTLSTVRAATGVEVSAVISQFIKPVDNFIAEQFRYPNSFGDAQFLFLDQISRDSGNTRQNVRRDTTMPNYGINFFDWPYSFPTASGRNLHENYTTGRSYDQVGTYDIYTRLEHASTGGTIGPCYIGTVEIVPQCQNDSDCPDQLSICDPDVKICVPSCGDGIRQAGEWEQCDDGNTINGDGCSETCQNEPPSCSLVEVEVVPQNQSGEPEGKENSTTFTATVALTPGVWPQPGLEVTPSRDGISQVSSTTFPVTTTNIFSSFGTYSNGFSYTLTRNGQSSPQCPAIQIEVLDDWSCELSSEECPGIQQCVQNKCVGCDLDIVFLPFSDAWMEYFANSGGVFLDPSNWFGVSGAAGNYHSSVRAPTNMGSDDDIDFFVNKSFKYLTINSSDNEGISRIEMSGGEIVGTYDIFTGAGTTSNPETIHTMTTVDVREDGDRDLIFVSELEGLSVLRNQSEFPSRDPRVDPWPEYLRLDQRATSSDRLFAIEWAGGDDQFHVINIAKNNGGDARRYNIAENATAGQGNPEVKDLAPWWSTKGNDYFNWGHDVIFDASPMTIGDTSGNPVGDPDEADTFVIAYDSPTKNNFSELIALSLEKFQNGDLNPNLLDPSGNAPEKITISFDNRFMNDYSYLQSSWLQAGELPGVVRDVIHDPDDPNGSFGAIYVFSSDGVTPSGSGLIRKFYPTQLPASSSNAPRTRSPAVNDPPHFFKTATTGGSLELADLDGDGSKELFIFSEPDDFANAVQGNAGTLKFEIHAGTEIRDNFEALTVEAPTPLQTGSDLWAQNFVEPIVVDIDQDGDPLCAPSFNPVCGDGILSQNLGPDRNEQCDDGNTTPGDGCSPTCEIEFCGDGVRSYDPNTGIGESCDPSAPSNTFPQNSIPDANKCNSQCEEAYCGDGEVNSFLHSWGWGGLWWGSRIDEECDSIGWCTGPGNWANSCQFLTGVQICDVEIFSLSANPSSVLTGEDVLIVLNPFAQRPHFRRDSISRDDGTSVSTSTVNLSISQPVWYSQNATFSTPGIKTGRVTVSNGGYSHACERTITVVVHECFDDSDCPGRQFCDSSWPANLCQDPPSADFSGHKVLLTDPIYSGDNFIYEIFYENLGPDTGDLIIVEEWGSGLILSGDLNPLRAVSGPSLTRTILDVPANSGGSVILTWIHDQNYLTATNSFRLIATGGVTDLTGDNDTGTLISLPVAFCSDGVINGTETCDDGNTTAGDGCSATCQLEMPICSDISVSIDPVFGLVNTSFVATFTGPANRPDLRLSGISRDLQNFSPDALLGNSRTTTQSTTFWSTGEKRLSFTLSNSGLTTTCSPGSLYNTVHACLPGTCPAGQSCDTSTAVFSCTDNCGNDTLDAGETCDDGNIIDDGNGCSASCQLETPSCTISVMPTSGRAGLDTFTISLTPTQSRSSRTGLNLGDGRMLENFSSTTFGTSFATSGTYIITGIVENTFAGTRDSAPVTGSCAIDTAIRVGECTDDSHCPAGDSCNPTTLTCEPRDPTCDLVSLTLTPDSGAVDATVFTASITALTARQNLQISQISRIGISTAISAPISGDGDSFSTGRTFSSTGLKNFSFTLDNAGEIVNCPATATGVRVHECLDDSDCLGSCDTSAPENYFCVPPSADFSGHKVLLTDPIYSGDNFIYEIFYENLGPDTGDLIIVEEWGSGLILSGDLNPLRAVSGPSLTRTILDVPANSGGSVILTWIHDQNYLTATNSFRLIATGGVTDLTGDNDTETLVSSPVRFCGDGNPDTDDWEQCDDGNTDNWDGCSASCEREAPICQEILSGFISPTTGLIDTTVFTATIARSGTARSGLKLSGFERGDFSGTNLDFDLSGQNFETTGSFSSTGDYIFTGIFQNGTTGASCTLSTPAQIRECFSDSHCDAWSRCDSSNSCVPRESDFSGHKVLLTNSVYSGQDIVYEIFYENLGPDTGDLILVESGGTGLILSGDANSGRTLSGNELIYEIFDLAPGASGSVLFTGLRDSTTESGDSVTNNFRLVGSGTTDSTGSNDTGSTSTGFSFCGDGTPDTNFSESCDDGNNSDGDGCSASCQTEAPTCDLIDISIAPTSGKIGETFTVALTGPAGRPTLGIDSGTRAGDPVVFSYDTVTSMFLGTVQIPVYTLDLVGNSTTRSSGRTFATTGAKTFSLTLSNDAGTVSCDAQATGIVHECLDDSDCLGSCDTSDSENYFCVPPSADFSGRKVLLTDPVYSGQNVVYEIFYENLGPDTGALVLVESGGTGLILSAGVNTDRQRSGTDQLIYDVGLLAPGETGSKTITMLRDPTTESGDSVTNNFRLVGSGTTDLSGGNNTGSLSTGFSFCGDRSVDVWEQCDDGDTIPGDGCSASCEREPPSCKITVTSNSIVFNTGDEIEITLSGSDFADPERMIWGVNFAVPQTGLFSHGYETGIITFDLFSSDFEAQVSGFTGPDGIYTGIAEKLGTGIIYAQYAHRDSGDIVWGCISSLLTITEDTSRADLSGHKKVLTDPIIAGEPIVYEIFRENLGPDTGDVQIIERGGSGILLTGGANTVNPYWTISADEAIYAVGPQGSGASGSVLFTGLRDPTAVLGDPISNSFSIVSSGGWPPDPDFDNSSSGNIITSYCGDGTPDNSSGEQCDDKNTVAGDGCFRCQLEQFSCDLITSTVIGTNPGTGGTEFTVQVGRTGAALTGRSGLQLTGITRLGQILTQDLPDDLSGADFSAILSGLQIGTGFFTGTFDYSGQQTQCRLGTAAVSIVECLHDDDCDERSRCDSSSNSCVSRQSDFSGHKVLLTNPIIPSEEIVYEIFYENLGPDTGDVVIVEEWGNGLILSGDLNPLWTVSGPSLTRTILGVPANSGGSVILTWLRDQSSMMVSNSFRLITTGGVIDLTGGNDTGSVIDVPVMTGYDLSISKTLLTQDQLNIGDLVTYEIVYSVSGYETARDVRIVDEFSTGLILTWADPMRSGISLTWARRNLWDLTTLTTGKIIVTGEVVSSHGAFGQISNTASISASGSLTQDPSTGDQRSTSSGSTNGCFNGVIDPGEECDINSLYCVDCQYALGRTGTTGTQSGEIVTTGLEPLTPSCRISIQPDSGLVDSQIFTATVLSTGFDEWRVDFSGLDRTDLGTKIQNISNTWDFGTSVDTIGTLTAHVTVVHKDSWSLTSSCTVSYDVHECLDDNHCAGNGTCDTAWQINRCASPICEGVRIRDFPTTGRVNQTITGEVIASGADRGYELSGYKFSGIISLNPAVEINQNPISITGSFDQIGQYQVEIFVTTGSETASCLSDTEIQIRECFDDSHCAAWSRCNNNNLCEELPLCDFVEIDLPATGLMDTDVRVGVSATGQDLGLQISGYQIGEVIRDLALFLDLPFGSTEYLSGSFASTGDETITISVTTGARTEICESPTEIQIRECFSAIDCKGNSCVQNSCVAEELNFQIQKELRPDTPPVLGQPFSYKISYENTSSITGDLTIEERGGSGLQLSGDLNAGWTFSGPNLIYEIQNLKPDGTGFVIFTGRIDESTAQNQEISNAVFARTSGGITTDSGALTVGPYLVGTGCAAVSCPTGQLCFNGDCRDPSPQFACEIDLLVTENLSDQGFLLGRSYRFQNSGNALTGIYQAWIDFDENFQFTPIQDESSLFLILWQAQFIGQSQSIGLPRFKAIQTVPDDTFFPIRSKRLHSTADVDGDGHDEIIATMMSGNARQIRNYNLQESRATAITTGEFASQTPRGVETYDLDFDGDEDLFIAIEDNNDEIRIFQNDAGQFQFTGAISLWSTGLTSFEVTDLSGGDAAIDLIISTSAGEILNLTLDPTQISSPVTPTTTTTIRGANNILTRAIDAADLDADGSIDLVVASQSTTGLEILFGPNFTSTSLNFTTQHIVGGTQDFSIIDIDSDGDLDILATTTAQTAQFTNVDSGNFPKKSLSNLPAGGTQFSQIQAAHRDGDCRRSCENLQAQIRTNSPNADTTTRWRISDEFFFTVTTGLQRPADEELTPALNAYRNGTFDYHIPDVTQIQRLPDVFLTSNRTTTQFFSGRQSFSGVGPQKLQAQIRTATGGIATCELAELQIDACGDGVVQSDLGEQCDDTVFIQQQKLRTGQIAGTGASKPPEIHDFNGDGIQDFIIVAEGVLPDNEETYETVINVFLGRGSGEFTRARTGFQTGFWEVHFEVRDIDDDGALDIFAGYANTPDNWQTKNPFYTTRFGDGTGGFTRWPEQEFSEGWNSNYTVAGPQGLDIADLDGDSRLDLIIVDEAEWEIHIFTGDGLPTKIKFRTGVDNIPGADSKNYTSQIRVIDIENDGDQDIIIPQYFSGDSSVDLIYFQNAGGTFVRHDTESQLENRTFRDIADIDADGILDIVATNTEGSLTDDKQMSIFRGGDNTGFRFERGTSYTATLTQPVLTDTNNDGFHDIVIPEWFSGEIRTFRGDGDFVFDGRIDKNKLPLSQGIINTIPVHLDDDGRIDFIAANYFTNQVSVLQNTTAPLPGDGCSASCQFEQPSCDFITGSIDLGTNSGKFLTGDTINFEIQNSGNNFQIWPDLTLSGIQFDSFLALDRKLSGTLQSGLTFTTLGTGTIDAILQNGSKIQSCPLGQVEIVECFRDSDCQSFEKCVQNSCIPRQSDFSGHKKLLDQIYRGETFRYEIFYENLGPDTGNLTIIEQGGSGLQLSDSLNSPTRQQSGTTLIHQVTNLAPGAAGSVILTARREPGSTIPTITNNFLLQPDPTRSLDPSTGNNSGSITEIISFCGDGVRDANFGEECDGGADCSASCELQEDDPNNQPDPQEDICPAGDFSPSFYDGECGDPQEPEEHQLITPIGLGCRYSDEPYQDLGPFTDSVGHRAFPHIDTLRINCIARGIGRENNLRIFAPEREISRMEITKILVRVLGIGFENFDVEDEDALFSGPTPLADVPANFRGAHYIPSAQENGLLEHLITRSDGQQFLDPDRPMTRREAIVSLIRARNQLNGLSDIDPTRQPNPFTDISPATEFYEEIITATTLGIISGVPQPDGSVRFEPDRPITRAEFAKIVSTAFPRQLLVDAEETVLNSDLFKMIQNSAENASNQIKFIRALIDELDALDSRAFLRRYKIPKTPFLELLHQKFLEPIVEQDLQDS